jgi:hypothetical protein
MQQAFKEFFLKKIGVKTVNQEDVMIYDMATQSIESTTSQLSGNLI